MVSQVLNLLTRDHVPYVKMDEMEQMEGTERVKKQSLIGLSPASPANHMRKGHLNLDVWSGPPTFPLVPENACEKLYLHVPGEQQRGFFSRRAQDTRAGQVTMEIRSR